MCRPRSGSSLGHLGGMSHVFMGFSKAQRRDAPMSPKPWGRGGRSAMGVLSVLSLTSDPLGGWSPMSGAWESSGVSMGALASASRGGVRVASESVSGDHTLAPRVGGFPLAHVLWAVGRLPAPVCDSSADTPVRPDPVSSGPCVGTCKQDLLPGVCHSWLPCPLTGPGSSRMGGAAPSARLGRARLHANTSGRLLRNRGVSNEAEFSGSLGFPGARTSHGLSHPVWQGILTGSSNHIISWAFHCSGMNPGPCPAPGTALPTHQAAGLSRPQLVPGRF